MDYGPYTMARHYPQSSVPMASYGRDPPPPPPPRSMNLGTAAGGTSSVPKHLIGAPPPPPPGPPPPKSPRCGGDVDPKQILAKRIVEERRKAAYAMYEPSPQLPFGMKEEELNPVSSSTDESSQEEKGDRYAAKLSVSTSTSAQDENKWEASTTIVSNKSSSKHRHSSSSPVTVDKYIKKRPVPETAKSPRPKTPKAAASPQNDSSKPLSPKNTDVSAQPGISSHGGGKPRKSPKGGGKGFFKKFLGLNKSKNKEHQFERPANVHPGQSYKSSAHSAEIVVRKHQEPAAETSTIPSKSTRPAAKTNGTTPATKTSVTSVQSPRPSAPSPEASRALEHGATPTTKTNVPSPRPATPSPEASRALEPGGKVMKGSKPATLRVQTLEDHDITESFSSPRFDEFKALGAASSSTSSENFPPGVKHVHTTPDEWSVGDDVSAMTDPSFAHGFAKTPPALASVLENGDPQSRFWKEKSIGTGKDPEPLLSPSVDPDAAQASEWLEKKFFSPADNADFAPSPAFEFGGELEESSVETPPRPRTPGRDPSPSLRVETTIETTASERKETETKPLTSPLNAKALEYIKKKKSPRRGRSPSKTRPFSSSAAAAKALEYTKKNASRRRSRSQSPAPNRSAAAKEIAMSNPTSPRPYFAKFQGRKPRSLSKRGRRVPAVEKKGQEISSSHVPAPAMSRLDSSKNHATRSHVAPVKEPVILSLPPGDRKIDGATVLLGLAAKACRRRELIAEGKAAFVEPTQWKTPARGNRSAAGKGSPFSIDEKDAKDPIHRAGRRLLSQNAVPIQAQMRRFLAQREAVDRLWAIVELQSYFRRWRCEAFLYAHTSAAVKIQAAFRGWKSRDRADDEYFSAVQIQRAVRGYLAAIYAYDKLYRVIFIQAAMRRTLARNRYFELRGERHCLAATSIQAAWRRYITQLHFQYDIVDIIIVQTVARRWMASRRLAIVRDKKRIESAVTIQSAWRGYKGFTEFIFSMADILIVQRTARKWLAIRKVRVMRLERSATKIQSQWRSYQAQMVLLYSLVHIIVVQAVARRYLARQKLRDMKEGRAPEAIAAVKIQRAWRGFWDFSHYLIVHYEIVKLQAVWRGHRDRREVTLKLGCTILLQAVARGFLARKRAREARTARVVVASAALTMRENMACKRIQRKWRETSTYVRKKKAALVIERFFLMVKQEVDREIRRHKEKKSNKRERRKRGKKEPDGAVLERAWLHASSSQLSEKKCADKAKEKKKDDPSVSSGRDKEKQRDASDRSVSSGRDKEKRRDASVKLVKKGTSRPKASNAPTSSVHMDRDDDAVSALTFPTTMAQAPRSSRHVRLNAKEMGEDLSLEEAWIDTNVLQAKEERQREEAYLRRYGLQGAPSRRHGGHRKTHKIGHNDIYPPDDLRFSESYRSDDIRRSESYRSHDLPRPSESYRSNDLRLSESYQSNDLRPSAPRSPGRSRGHHYPASQPKSPSRGIMLSPRHRQVPSPSHAALASPLHRDMPAVRNERPPPLRVHYEDEYYYNDAPDVDEPYEEPPEVYYDPPPVSPGFYSSSHYNEELPPHEYDASYPQYVERQPAPHYESPHSTGRPQGYVQPAHPQYESPRSTGRPQGYDPRRYPNIRTGMV